MPLQLKECPSCNEEVPPRYTAADLYFSFYEGHIIDARAGGFVLGRDNNEDDITMISAVAPGIFQVCGLMQGGEYIINREATSKHMERIEEINSYKSSEDVFINSITINNKTRVFNTNGIKGNLVMLIEAGQFIINRAATAEHYFELEDLNNSVAHELRDS
jgi:hypothetical protein